MNFSQLNYVENNINNDDIESALSTIKKQLLVDPKNKIWFTLLLRCVHRSASLENARILNQCLESFLSSRVDSGLDTMSVWNLVSKANSLLMKSGFISPDFVSFLENNKRDLRNKPRILMLSCVWQRQDLTDAFYSHYARLREHLSEQLDLQLLVVGSEGEQSRRACERYGFLYVEHPNQPLTSKWQAGVEEARSLDFDALVIMGSDDFVSSSVFEFYRRCLESNFIFLGFLDLYLYDVASGEAGYWRGYGSASGGAAQPARVGETIGLGRMLSRELLEYLDFNLWKGFNANKSLDGLMKKRVQQATGMLPINFEDATSVSNGYKVGLCSTSFKGSEMIGFDVKHSTNVTSFQKYKISNECYETLDSEYVKEIGLNVEIDDTQRINVNLEEKCEKVVIAIPTFNRPREIKELVRQLIELKKVERFKLKIIVYDDGSDEKVRFDDLTVNENSCVDLYRSPVNNGKKGYWRVVNFLLDKLEEEGGDYYFYLPDDVTLAETFLSRSIALWNSISDSKKVSLNLLNDGREECWTKFKRVPVEGSKLYRSQWLDMAMIFNGKLLQHRVNEVDKRIWERNPLSSSGVGAQLSQRFHALDYGMYQVKSSLVYHGSHESKMNPEERILNPLVSTNESSFNESSKVTVKQLDSAVRDLDYIVICNSYPSTDGNFKGGEFIRERVEAYTKSGLKGSVLHVSKALDGIVLEQQCVSVYRLSLEYIEELISSLVKSNASLLFHSPVPQVQKLVCKNLSHNKVIYWFHGSDVLSYKRFIFSDISESRKKYLENLDLQRKQAAKLSFDMDGLICILVSSYLRESIFSQIGTLPKNARVIPNFINSERYRFIEKADSLKRKIAFIRPFNGNAKYATDLAIESIIYLSRQDGFDSLEILVQGFGDFFQREVAPLRSFPNVKIVESYSSASELSRVFKDYGVFLCPTRHDTQGVIMCEAMSSGMVCVTNKNSSIPEYLDESSGFLVDTLDSSDLGRALHEAVTDKNFKQRSYSASRRVREQCGFEATIRKELEIIKK